MYSSPNLLQMRMSWSIACKLACNFVLLLTCIGKIITLVHSREIALNRISLVPYQLLVLMTVFECNYYTLFCLFNIRDLDPQAYASWRALLSCPVTCLQCVIFLVLAAYADLLRELLKY